MKLIQNIPGHKDGTFNTTVTKDFTKSYTHVSSLSFQACCCCSFVNFNVITMNRRKNFHKNQVQVRVDLKNVQKQGRDENTRRLFCCRKIMVKKDWQTRRLSCCRKVMVKKDWKTTLHLLHSQATEVD